MTRRNMPKHWPRMDGRFRQRRYRLLWPRARQYRTGRACEAGIGKVYFGRPKIVGVVAISLNLASPLSCGYGPLPASISLMEATERLPASRFDAESAVKLAIPTIDWTLAGAV